MISKGPVNCLSSCETRSNVYKGGSRKDRLYIQPLACREFRVSKMSCNFVAETHVTDLCDAKKSETRCHRLQEPRKD